MKNRKINVDRPQLTAEEVMAGKNFEAVLRNHQVMSKPFYKQNWFFGATGLASLGLVIGGTFAFQDSPREEQLTSDLLNTDAPPNLTVPDNGYLAITARYHESTNELAKKTIQINPLNITPLEETSTLNENPPKPIQEKVNISDESDHEVPLREVETEQDEEILAENIEKEVSNDNSTLNPQEEEGKTSFGLDMNPRISNKIGGSITRNELLDNKGITTEGDVSIIHFELHLIDGLGGKVFTEESNQLNQEMRDALENVGQGETIYFENIRGKVKNGTEVRLNPLRYVLMN